MSNPVFVNSRGVAYWPIQINCPKCHGWGGDPKENGGTGRVCFHCSGKGKTPMPMTDLFDICYWKLFE